MKVLTFGTFDKLHPGHLNFFRQAGQHGELFVVVARDNNVQKIKGKKPRQGELTRLQKVKSLPLVKDAFLGHKKKNFHIIKSIKPDLICLGYDQKVDLTKLKKFLLENNLKTKVLRLKPHKPHLYKSSLQ